MFFSECDVIFFPFVVVHSGASMYNLCDEEEEEDGGATSKDKVDENDKTKEKMKIIRTKMENLTLNKKVPAKVICLSILSA